MVNGYLEFSQNGQMKKININANLKDSLRAFNECSERVRIVPENAAGGYLVK